MYVCVCVVVLYLFVCLYVCLCLLCVWACVYMCVDMFQSDKIYISSASLCFAKHDTKQAIRKYAETIHLDPAFFEVYEGMVACGSSSRGI